MGPPGSPAMLTLVSQFDEKHTEKHARLRKELEKELDEVKAELTLAKKTQQTDHDAIINLNATGERRKELSGRQAVLYASLIAVGGRLLEVVLTRVLP